MPLSHAAKLCGGLVVVPHKLPYSRHGRRFGFGQFGRRLGLLHLLYLYAFRLPEIALFCACKGGKSQQRMESLMPHGNWLALYQQRPTVQDGGLFKPDRLTTIHALPAGRIRWVRGWDFAATTDGGDYTAGAKLGLLEDGRYLIANIARGQYGAHERDAVLRNTAAADTAHTKISIPQDPGQAGKSQVLYLTRQLAGFSVSATPESGDKVTRAEPFAAQLNVGNVLVLDDGTWDTAALLAEMRLFPNGKHDDQIDALSRAFGELISKPDVSGRFKAMAS